MSNVPSVFLMTAVSSGHPYVLNQEALSPGYHSRTFTGRRLPDDWQPPPHTVERKSAKLADALGYETSFPLFSERAANLLGAAAPDCAEFRHFTEVRGKPYYLMNVLVSADVLDEQQSECTRSKSGEIITIVKHAFRQELLKLAPPMFKLPGRFDSSIFVTRSIPEMVVLERLTGFQFRDPEHNPMRDLYLGKDVNVVAGVLP